MANFKRPKTLILGMFASLVLLVGILFIFDTPDDAVVAFLTLVVGLVIVMAVGFVAGTLLAWFRKWRNRDR